MDHAMIIIENAMLTGIKNDCECLLFLTPKKVCSASVVVYKTGIPSLAGFLGRTEGVTQHRAAPLLFVEGGELGGLNTQWCFIECNIFARTNFTTIYV